MTTVKINASDAEDNGTPVQFRDPETWPEPVDAATLLNEMSAFIRRFVVLSPQAADALAAWVLAGYAVDALDFAPIVIVRSPTKRCGKSRLFEVLELLVRRPFSTVNASGPALFRTIESFTPTVFMDEAERLAEQSDRAQEQREILNAGYRRGPRIPRCVGDSHEVRYFDVFGFKAIAAIGRLRDTLEDRAISIDMRRKRRDECVERFRRRKVVPEAEALRRKAARWVQDHLPGLQGFEPELPEFLDDRAQDLWEPLLAVAALAGGGWYERLMQAARALSGNRADDLTEAIQLLADLHCVWRACTATRLSSAELLAELHSMEDRPWAESVTTPKRLASLLKPFGIQPRAYRFSLRTLQGYERSQFEDAFSRYLPPDPQQAQQTRSGAENRASASRNRETHVADAKEAESPHDSSTVADVADRGRGS